MNILRRSCFGLVLAGLCTAGLGQESNTIGARAPTTADEIYGQGVRETAWQPPDRERQGFHLPPGFQIELFAAEPQIAKPMNMAWDDRGRLWVTSTQEYPYPAEAGAATRDTIQILEDLDQDGRADKSTTFADGLNIPIGLLPVQDGVICFSIPNLWLLRDTDGDDHVDERKILLGPFDTSRDTHGMINSLHRGDDGWIYACHGFNNQSQVTARDGSSVKLMSGNTFRFKEDGSRIEQVTHGQVNPFGMTSDEWGNWYTADCHSKPLTALLPGACYPSFGRPHDGLGFAPEMMSHLHGSTAICGLIYYQAEQFPPAYRRRFYSGNVMTSRINCNALQWRGATAQAVELADFLTSDDPWFRPVDIQLGPDGCLYVADFYNKIIGHYEVPLEHPERDRDSGRIWRIVYRGDAEHLPPIASEIDSGNLIRELSSENAARRELAVEAAIAHNSIAGDEASKLLFDPEQSELLRISCLEILFRQNPAAAHSRLIPHDSPHQHLLVRQLKLAADLPPEARAKFLQEVRKAIPFANPQANRAVCPLLATSGDWQDIINLGSFAADRSDTATAHAARIAIRDLLSNDSQLAMATAGWPPSNNSTNIATPTFAIESRESQVIAGVLPAVDSALAADRLLTFVSVNDNAPPALTDAAISLATKFASDALIERLLELISHKNTGNLANKAKQFERVCESYLIKHPALPTEITDFGKRLQTDIEVALAAAANGETRPLAWKDATQADWSSEKRRGVEGVELKLRSSFTRGESYTGKLISQPFSCPSELSFVIAGHNGPPSESDQQLNRMDLRLVESGQILKTAYPPRSDVAQSVRWKLAKFTGQTVQLIATDGDAGRAYAWLAFGQFSKSGLDETFDPSLLEAYLVVLRRGFADLDAKPLSSLGLSMTQRAELLTAALAGKKSALKLLLATHALAIQRSDLVVPEAISMTEAESILNWAKQIASACAVSEQSMLASSLTDTVAGCDLLARLIDEGAVSALCLKKIEPQFPPDTPPATKKFLEKQFQLSQTMPSLAKSATQRLAELDLSATDLDLGKQLYQQHCAACHQLRGQGNLVGPQLDGAVVRSIERLGEDILEPNANVDKAFRSSVIMLDNDTVLTGLLREQTDGTVVVTGVDGKSQQYSQDRILQRRDTNTSLMPANLGELLNDLQLAALLAYLKHQPAP